MQTTVNQAAAGGMCVCAELAPRHACVCVCAAAFKPRAECVCVCVQLQALRAEWFENALHSSHIPFACVPPGEVVKSPKVRDGHAARSAEAMLLSVCNWNSYTRCHCSIVACRSNTCIRSAPLDLQSSMSVRSSAPEVR